MREKVYFSKKNINMKERERKREKDVRIHNLLNIYVALTASGMEKQPELLKKKLILRGSIDDKFDVSKISLEVVGILEQGICS